MQIEIHAHRREIQSAPDIAVDVIFYLLCKSNWLYVLRVNYIGLLGILIQLKPATGAPRIQSRRKSKWQKGTHGGLASNGGEIFQISGLDAEKLEAALRADEAKLNGLVCDASIRFIYSGDSATDQLAKSLKDDVVMIGNGVRKDDNHFVIFEKLANVVHEHARKARIAFNTGPTDSDAAIQRWA